MIDIETIKKSYPLSNLKQNVDSLKERLSNAHISGENASDISAELNHKNNLLEEYLKIDKFLDDYSQNLEIISLNDPDLTEIAKAENPGLEEKLQQSIENIKKIEIDYELSDVADMRSSIIEIRAGAGGDEASLFATELFRMYSNYITTKGWSLEMIDASLSTSGGYKEVIALVKGEGVYRKLKYESGVHRVQRIPVTESGGRIHTSTVSVAILPEAKEIDVDIKHEDLVIETMRATGAGGQKTNKTSSAIRITHLPSGIVVSCQETKIQQQNKDKAMQMLRARLYEKKRSEQAEKRSNLRSSQIGNAMRAEKIRTYNFPQNRITDHRIKTSWHNIEAVMQGELDELLTELDEEMKGIMLEQLKKSKK